MIEQVPRLARGLSGAATGAPGCHGSLAAGLGALHPTASAERATPPAESEMPHAGASHAASQPALDPKHGASQTVSHVAARVSSTSAAGPGSSAQHTSLRSPLVRTTWQRRRSRGLLLRLLQAAAVRRPRASAWPPACAAGTRALHSSSAAAAAQPQAARDGDAHAEDRAHATNTSRSLPDLTLGPPFGAAGSSGYAVHVSRHAFTPTTLQTRTAELSPCGASASTPRLGTDEAEDEQGRVPAAVAVEAAADQDSVQAAAAVEAAAAQGSVQAAAAVDAAAAQGSVPAVARTEAALPSLEAMFGALDSYTSTVGSLPSLGTPIRDDEAAGLKATLLQALAERAPTPLQPAPKSERSVRSYVEDRGAAAAAAGAARPVGGGSSAPPVKVGVKTAKDLSRTAHALSAVLARLPAQETPAPLQPPHRAGPQPRQVLQGSEPARAAGSGPAIGLAASGEASPSRARPPGLGLGSAAELKGLAAILALEPVEHAAKAAALEQRRAAEEQARRVREDAAAMTRKAMTRKAMTRKARESLPPQPKRQAAMELSQEELRARMLSLLGHGGAAAAPEQRGRVERAAGAAGAIGVAAEEAIGGAAATAAVAALRSLAAQGQALAGQQQPYEVQPAAAAAAAEAASAPPAESPLGAAALSEEAHAPQPAASVTLHRYCDEEATHERPEVRLRSTAGCVSASLGSRAARSTCARELGQRGRDLAGFTRFVI
jgi:hypothetical protein